MKSLHLIQWIHIWNTMIGVVVFGTLIGVSKNIKVFIDSGSKLAGFGMKVNKTPISIDLLTLSYVGSFTTFAYPATYVFMLIPTICSMIYSAILAFDSSPNYKAWSPSKTLRSTIIFFTAALWFAALLPAVPGADVMTDGSAMSCNWTNYMQWKIQFNDPITYPWVTGMDNACSILKASDGMCWVLFLGWLLQSYLYMRAAHRARSVLNK
ncbi:uncharacterized protein EV154DRAFT_566819 [Mucor mucedo]|uniref:uncharacterized protein n=1 Tax=Mucor mucedo TaxID=29922 RepID=UPI002220B7AB|nr:uncharacterized protein EV154DRAFT_566819 [Mucor mucedo]KAI7888018.1 hypothetical protein EV154DRAFT_566819 [Mucor mucedo]